MESSVDVAGNGNPAVSEEEALRAGLYRLISLLLSAEPNRETLDKAAALTGGVNPLGKAVELLAKRASETDPETLRDEYFTLFIGLGRGVLVPFGSYYLTGFLHEKPLAKLRVDMAKLGIVSDPDLKEPEDHIASVLEIMAGLIDGSFGETADLETQRRFFDAHVASWTPHFFKDLEEVTDSQFYAAVGGVGRTFLEIEENAFKML